MRIGVRLTPDLAHGALVDGGALVAAGSGAPDELPARLAGGRRVDTVTWDVSAVLDASLGSVTGRVAAVRVLPGVTRAAALDGHPSALVRALVGWRARVTGGHDLFGAELAPLDLDAGRAAELAAAGGLDTLAITATGAVGRADHEREVAARVLARRPGLRLCLSCEVGGPGLLEREAATVLNAALLDVADELVDRCAAATAALPGEVTCGFVTGEGGRVSAERLRSLPVLGLGAGDAARLSGAAVLGGAADAAVVLVGREEIAVGHVRDGLPRVEPDLAGPHGVRLAAPRPALTGWPAGAVAAVAADLAGHEPQRAVVVVPDDAEDVAAGLLAGGGWTPVVVRPAADPGAVGAACARAGAWLDVVATAETADELDRLRERVRQRALTVVATSGAAPGEEARVVESTARPVAYLRSGVYRLHVRATGAS
ncbi:hypothetical protein [Saccharothrix australiensis]|uniref:Hydantoinase/oxoprolinase-like protein n=1 Tax=Saccharothrix australiensis TaxID=2072 RepID=A0A495VZG1_9PSEU|nr:hypothetical protein [Saccharothrix australiensis]RKT54604.1 hypothetical protein C8E97_3250 [Saccharothrix australiensis]